MAGDFQTHPRVWNQRNNLHRKCKYWITFQSHHQAIQQWGTSWHSETCETFGQGRVSEPKQSLCFYSLLQFSTFEYDNNMSSFLVHSINVSSQFEKIQTDQSILCIHLESQRATHMDALVLRGESNSAGFRFIGVGFTREKWKCLSL